MTLEEIADTLESAGISSPFSTDYEATEAWRQANPGKAVNYNDHPMTDRLHLDPAQLPEGWRCAVHDILARRRVAELEAEADALIEKLPEALRIVAQSRRRLRSFRPKAADLRDLWTMNNRHGKRVNTVYKGDPRCTLRLKLSDAVQIDYEQASYADHSRFVIPVEGERPTDLSSCIANLNRFCDAIRTHNGFAGSGSSWTMELVDTPAGLVVYADCRASISD